VEPGDAGYGWVHDYQTLYIRHALGEWARLRSAFRAGFTGRIFIRSGIATASCLIFLLGYPVGAALAM